MGRDAAQLRGELRELVNTHVPEGFLGAFTDNPADLETAQQFCRTLADNNLLCLSWPEEFGGGGASVWEQTVVREEMWAHHEPRGAQYMGVNWVGPIIMRHGTEEQQRKHLPPIARGEVIWCQGFSEPEAGSDLASLRTTARQDGDGWLVSGQKIWTSYATMAQWCFLLARTHKGEKKQQGLTIFLVPMDDPAIQVRPIRCMMGPHHLNEVFFDDLRVTSADVLGEVDKGWSIVAGRDVLRACRHRPLRAVRTAAGRRTVRPRRPLGGPARRAAGAMDTHADPLSSGPPARVSRCLAAEQRSDPARRRRGLPHRRDKTRSGQRGSADGHRRRGVAGRSRRPVVPRRDRRPLEVLAGVHGVLRQHRDAAHPAVPRTAGGDQMSEMILDLGDDAKEYGRQALRAFDAAGGDQLVQQAEAKPDIRDSLVGPVLNELGAWELDARTDADGLEAAAALCRSAGYWALPYPVAERLAKPTDTNSDGLIVVASNRPSVPSAASRHGGRQ